jgi:hypothetical protein
MNPLTEVFGDTPDVAPYIETILGDEQLKALKENLAAFPQIEKLGGKYYDYMLGLMDRSIPGFADILSAGGDLTKKMQGIAAEELGGQIPQDVVDQLTRSTAYQNLTSGIFGGPMGAANQARNLGLTSLDMIQKGMATEQASGNAAQRWANMASALNMNPAAFFVTPEQQFGATMQNRLYQQQTQQLRNNLEAAPNPVAKGVSDTIINLIGAYLGKGGGGGGTAPSYSPTQYAGDPMRDVTTPGHYVTSGGGGGGGGGSSLQFNQPFGQPSNYNPYVTNPTGDISGLGYGNVFNITGAPEGYPPMGIYNNPPTNETMYPSPTWY